MAFKDYNQIVEPLALPINGKLYTIPPVSIAGGIRLDEGLAPDSEKPMPDEEFKRITLGDALDEMRADSVRPTAISLAAMTALADHQTNRGAAEIMWESNGNPKALEDRLKTVTNRATRRKTPPAAATTTPRRASGSGTKTSPKS
jgi:hypothetical protein